MKLCEECDNMFEPKQPNYIDGFSCDVLCEDCCDRENEEQFARNELERCGG